MTPEIRQRLEILRNKQLQGTITLDECREAVLLIREGRIAAATQSAASRAKKVNTVTQIDFSDL